MFEFFRKLWIGWVGIMMAYYAIILAVGATVAVVNFAWLTIEGRLAEAATMYISVAGFAALIAFVVWVHCDAAASSRRLEKHLKKSAAPAEDGEDDVDEDHAKASSSEHVRPAPRQDY